MNEQFDKIVSMGVQTQEQALALIEKLFAVARPGAVFSEPVSAEGKTVITASEVNVGMGVGFGSGAGGPEAGDDEEATSEEAGYGTGGGGGGMSAGRPVAVISIDEEGVQVEPIVDATKVALAFFTTLGSMFFMLTKMRKASRG